MRIQRTLRPGHRQRHGACRLGGAFLHALLLTAATATGQDAGKRHLALEDYLSWETVNDPQISPDGATVVYARRFVDAMAARIRTE